MWIILGVLLSLSAFALEPFETIKDVKIIRVLPDNIVVLNRGLEDGILRNDHIKLSNDLEGYSARAICIKASGDLSYWKIYRVPNSEAFSVDYTYTISSISQSEIPSPQSELRNFEQKVTDIEQKKEELGPNPFAVKPDLPERLTERDLIKAIGPEKRKLFLEQALNREQIERDLKDYRFSVFASPFTRQSINEGETLRYGFRGGNIASKYRLLTQFEQQQTKLKDPLTNESVSTRSTNAQAQFIIHQLSKSMSSLSLVNFNSQRFSRVATPKSHWQVGPMGFTWHMYESKTWEYLDLSYIPLFDVRTTEILNADSTISTEKVNGLRHGMRLAMRSKINDKVSFENLLWVRPYQDLASWAIETDNLNLVNDLKLVFSLTEKLFFDYNFVYQKDKLWSTLSNLPENNTINSINVRYDFDL